MKKIEMLNALKSGADPKNILVALIESYIEDDEPAEDRLEGLASDAQSVVR